MDIRRAQDTVRSVLKMKHPLGLDVSDSFDTIPTTSDSVKSAT